MERHAHGKKSELYNTLGGFWTASAPSQKANAVENEDW
jgi:hypothetical protein